MYFQELITYCILNNNRIALSNIYDNSILLCVLGNTIVLAMDGLVPESAEKIMQ